MEKIKQFLQSEKGKDILTVIIVIFVGLGSFALGRLSKENGSNGLKIEYNGQETDLTASAVNANNAGNNGGINPYLAPGAKMTPSESSQKQGSGEYFASSRGKKYYPVNCSAGKSIKIENRIYFTTASEAENKGYTLSGSCN